MIYAATKLLSSASGVYSTAASRSMMMSSPHPLLVQASRPLQNHQWSHFLQQYGLSPSSSSSALTSRYYQLIARWRKNFSRLYARRIMELAVASTAASRLRSQTEAAIAKPSECKIPNNTQINYSTLLIKSITPSIHEWLPTQPPLRDDCKLTPLVIANDPSCISQST